MGLQDKSIGINLSMGLESVKMFDTLEEELDSDIGYRKRGGLVPITSEEEFGWVQNQVIPLVKEGLEIEFLERSDLREIEPILGDNVYMASYCPLECQVNPIKLANSYAKAASRLGSTIITNTNVLGFRQDSKNKITSVIADRGEIVADVFVNAAGTSSPALAQMVNLKINVVPRKGQIVLLGPCEKREIHAIMHGASYFAIRNESDDSFSDNLGLAFAVEQRDEYIRLGVTRQFLGNDRVASKEVSKKIIENAMKIIPSITKYSIKDAVVGLRPYTPDHKLILGIDKKVPNLVFATGHEGEGTTLSPITGVLIAELVFDGKTHIPIDELNPSRFL